MQHDARQAMRGIHVCVPRDMTQAAGFYNTLLRSDEPAMVIECLNGYRLKETASRQRGRIHPAAGPARGAARRHRRDRRHLRLDVPHCAGAPLSSQPRWVFPSKSLTCKRSCPLDAEHRSSPTACAKPAASLFADEDVPGGATAYMMQQVLDGQNAYQLLDSPPALPGSPRPPPVLRHRLATIFPKPNAEDVFDMAYDIMREAEPEKFPAIY
ncbi:MAG: hypothetical protein WKG07_41375 [Hymenobacter sp.]